ncbi:hypothetical protein [Streptomyces sp. UG1]|uniref:hypothetical protein n=1 Tax=Streptomyces sp. UG1 TaxID=3417652 RepID=UPI003CF49CD0
MGLPAPALMTLLGTVLALLDFVADVDMPPEGRREAYGASKEAQARYEVPVVCGEPGPTRRWWTGCCGIWTCAG